MGRPAWLKYQIRSSRFNVARVCGMRLTLAPSFLIEFAFFNGAQVHGK